MSPKYEYAPLHEQEEEDVSEHQIPLRSKKTVLKGEFGIVYPDNNFHVKHYLHLWRKLHHAVVTGRSIDEDILDYDHTVHCTVLIMEWITPGFEKRTITHSRPGRPFCRDSKSV